MELLNFFGSEVGVWKVATFCRARTMRGLAKPHLVENPPYHLGEVFTVTIWEHLSSLLFQPSTSQARTSVTAAAQIIN
ncbi:hypothetical protein TNCT_494791 [Trichonephila clavata]|uniref:Uncharacterized protein n=1 Tax=Trichonephila clavata TaxID=2740835 RepID=A0A8X6KUS0_TRICU|nr:hypothetical protein TNCT_494791 [Trichonephila clavata]